MVVQSGEDEEFDRVVTEYEYVGILDPLTVFGKEILDGVVSLLVVPSYVTSQV